MNHALESRFARASQPDAPPLTELLAALEGADWALVFPGEGALLTALAALTAGGTLRVDPRLPLSERAARAAGFEWGSFDADWRGATVLTVEPDERAVKRAAKAEARLIADGTYCPGSGMLTQGAQWVVYRNAGVLSGHADLPFAALLGTGEAPSAPGAGVSAFTDALLRRDLPTLCTRLARQTRAAHTLTERLGERATLVSGAVLHVQGELPDTPLFTASSVLGTVTSARFTLDEGVLLSAGLENVEDLWRDLTGNVAPVTGVVDDVTPEEAAPQLADAQEEPVEEPVEEPTEEAAETPSEPQPEAPITPDIPAAPATASETTDPTEGLSEAQLAAFERLRDWRNAEARRAEVSRFIIASNATLAEIARQAPQTVEELRAVKGMGPERTRKYAEPLLTMVRGLNSED